MKPIYSAGELELNKKSPFGLDGWESSLSEVGLSSFSVAISHLRLAAQMLSESWLSLSMIKMFLIMKLLV